MSQRALFALLIVVSLFGACARQRHPGTNAPQRTDLITRNQVAELGVRNLYEVVERLHPRWLVVRSGMRSFSMETEVVVFQDQLFLGTQDALRGLGTEGVYQIQYLDGATAKATLPGLGDRHVQGAIVVHMNPP